MKGNFEKFWYFLHKETDQLVKIALKNLELGLYEKLEDEPNKVLELQKQKNFLPEYKTMKPTPQNNMQALWNRLQFE